MEWEVIALFFVFAFPGITIAGITSYWTKNIHSPWARVLARSALVSIAIAPVFGPHGGILPAIWIFALDPTEWLTAFVRMLVVWALSVPLIYAITRQKSAEPKT
jgi:hypothetical protein